MLQIFLVTLPRQLLHYFSSLHMLCLCREETTVTDG